MVGTPTASAWRRSVDFAHLQTDCTTGSLRMFAMRGLPVVPICRTARCLWCRANQKHLLACPALIEGRFAVVTNVERGMRWTRQFQALLR